ncbi:MAG: hypothetical protein WC876_09085 [Candidatus Thermoplasmatota archaeon]|jgi:hypothetical protein
MRNAKRADILLQEADRAKQEGNGAVEAWLTRRARDYLLPHGAKRVVAGRPS